MLTAESEMDCCLNSATQTEEHSGSSNACVCVPLSVMFVVAIILLSLSLVTTERGIFRLNSTLQVKIN